MKEKFQQEANWLTLPLIEVRLSPLTVSLSHIKFLQAIETKKKFPQKDF
jgi:hypothetical protein